MPFTMAGMGVPQVVLRKIDGHEILRRVERHGVTIMCAAPAVVAAVLECAQTWEGPIPGRGRTRIVVAGAPPPTRTIQRVEEELGWEFIQIYGLTETSPLLTVNRARPEWDDLPAAERAARLSRAGTPALGVRLRVDEEGEVLARSNVVLEGYWENPEETDRVLEGGWFHTGDGGVIDDGLPDHPGPQEGRHHHRRRERLLDRGRGRHLQPPGRRRGRRDRRARREVGRDDQGAGGQGRGIGTDRAGADRLREGARSLATRRRPRWSSARCWTAPPPASCRSSSCGRRTGKGATGRSTRPPADEPSPYGDRHGRRPVPARLRCRHRRRGLRRRRRRAGRGQPSGGDPAVAGRGPGPARRAQAHARSQQGRGDARCRAGRPPPPG